MRSADSRPFDPRDLTGPHRFAGRDHRIPGYVDQHRWRRSVRDHRGHHPWRFLGEHFPRWDVVVKPRHALPVGRLGITKWDLTEIWIAEDMNVADRRCTIAHETGHLIRGPFPGARKVYEEALVDRQAARLLLPSVQSIGQALGWAKADYALAADELWVDEATLNTRLSTLAPRERARLTKQLGMVLVDAPA
jgi:hypothetical protein